MRRVGRQFSLVEVMVATFVLTVALMGVMSSYTVIQRSHRVTKERTAARLAALSVLDQISAFHQNNVTAGAALTKATFNDPNGRGFEVFFSSSQAGQGGGALGRGRDETTADTELSAALDVTRRTLRPATDLTLFPASRAAAGTPHTEMAGFVTIEDVSGRSSLIQVHVIVAWRGELGDERIAYTAILGEAR